MGAASSSSSSSRDTRADSALAAATIESIRARVASTARISILGRTRSGKTALLHHLRHRMSPDPIVYTPAEDAACANAMVLQLLAGFNALLAPLKAAGVELRPLLDRDAAMLRAAASAARAAAAAERPAPPLTPALAAAIDRLWQGEPALQRAYDARQAGSVELENLAYLVKRAHALAGGGARRVAARRRRQCSHPTYQTSCALISPPASP